MRGLLGEGYRNEAGLHDAGLPLWSTPLDRKNLFENLRGLSGPTA